MVSEGVACDRISLTKAIGMVIITFMRLKKRKFGFIGFPYMPTGVILFSMMPNSSDMIILSVVYAR